MTPYIPGKLGVLLSEIESDIAAFPETGRIEVVVISG
jgi:hypothetical protein